MIESAREVHISVRVGGKNSKNIWLSDGEKTLVEKLKAALKEV